MANVELQLLNRIGRGYSGTTAHGTKANGFVFLTGQVAAKPGQDGLKERERVGEMGTLEEQTVRSSKTSKQSWKRPARCSTALPNGISI
jgi:hypothetical protein